MHHILLNIVRTYTTQTRLNQEYRKTYEYTEDKWGKSALINVFTYQEFNYRNLHERLKSPATFSNKIYYKRTASVNLPKNYVTNQHLKEYRVKPQLNSKYIWQLTGSDPKFYYQ